MKKMSSLMQWGSAHQLNWFVVLRVILGILLLTKGIEFTNNIVQLQELLSRQKNAEFQFSFLAFVIAWAHIFGGLFIILGLFTRVFCLVQLPIVTAALIMAVSNNILSDYALVEIIAVFLLLMFFLLEGGGAISLDRYFNYKKLDDLRIGS